MRSRAARRAAAAGGWRRPTLRPNSRSSGSSRWAMTVRTSSRSLWWAARRCPKAVSRSRVSEIGGFLRWVRTISSTPPALRPGCRGRRPMVFVGYGIVAPEFDYNDYADVDVRGKVVVFLAGEPASDDPDYFGGRRADGLLGSREQGPHRPVARRGGQRADAGRRAWSGPACNGSTPSNTSVSPRRCRATSRSCCAPGSPPPCSTRLCSISTRSCPWSGDRCCARFTCR